MVSLYASWVEQLGRAPARSPQASRIRKGVGALLVDALLVAAIAIGAGLGAPSAALPVGELLHLGPESARWLVVGAAGLLALPFLVGLVRNARRLAIALASAALPEAAAGRPDLAAAPRQALLAAVQLGAALLVLVPVVAITQPFLPGVPGAAVLLVVMLVLGAGFWRSAAELQGHVRAGAQVVVEALARQGSPGAHAPEGDGHDALAAVRVMFPGMGDPVALRIDEGSPAAGRSLSALGVRGRTGATVLAISRHGESVIVPSGHEVLRPGDILALCGSHEAVAAAREVLRGAGSGDGAGRGDPPQEAAGGSGA
jgi:CPA2 family monovalent cation:H+ antiporter-2